MQRQKSAPKRRKIGIATDFPLGYTECSKTNTRRAEEMGKLKCCVLEWFPWRKNKRSGDT